MRMCRIIPARAGFTFSLRGHGFAASDHPRSRGVYPVDNPGDFGHDGSSPLARGLLAHDFVNIVAERIIPARAGFTPK